jgi:hypothetical protein
MLHAPPMPLEAPKINAHFCDCSSFTCPPDSYGYTKTSVSESVSESVSAVQNRCRLRYRYRFRTWATRGRMIWLITWREMRQILWLSDSFFD